MLLQNGSFQCDTQLNTEKIVYKKEKIKLKKQIIPKINIPFKKGKEDKAAELSDPAIGRNGKSGSGSGNIFELELESFKLGMVIREARIFRHLTQQELALKSGTTKYYISRIENNASDIRLSTLMKIICDGLEGKLKFALDF